MADVTINRLQQPPNDMIKRYRDMGDGTWAEVISADVSVTAGDTELVTASGDSLSNDDTNQVEVKGKGGVFDVALSLDTSIYASGDLLAAPQEVTGFFLENGGQALVIGLQLLDEDDQKQDVDILFFQSAVNAGTENSAYAITDAEARELMGWIDIAAADYTDWGDWSTATVKNTDTGFKVPGLLEAGAATTSVWVAALCRSGTPTYSASGIRLKIAVLYP